MAKVIHFPLCNVIVIKINRWGRTSNLFNRIYNDGTIFASTISQNWIQFLRFDLYGIFRIIQTQFSKCMWRGRLQKSLKRAQIDDIPISPNYHLMKNIEDVLKIDFKCTCHSTLNIEFYRMQFCAITQHENGNFFRLKMEIALVFTQFLKSHRKQ